MTPDELTRLRELDRTASPAPWGWSGGGQGSPILSANDAVGRLEYATEEDLDLITETRNAIPELIAEIERLTEENLELKRENHLAWSKGHAAGWDCHIVTMQSADLLPKDQKTSSPYQEKK